MKQFKLITILTLLFIAPWSASAAERSLWVGMSGSDVASYQNILIKHGYLGTGLNTGYFGSLTDAAVKKFQCDKEIICSGSSVSGYGIIGPKTRLALNAANAALNNPRSVTQSLTPAAVGSFEISGWLPDWRAASATKDVLPHLDKMTSVMPFGYTVSSDGKLIDHAKITEEPWVSFIAEAKRQGVRVVPTVMWGNGKAIHDVLSDQTKRIALEDEIAALVKKHDFDGIDIDFEAKHHETIDYFSTFLRGLYQRMGNKWVYCAIEVRMPIESRFGYNANVPPDAADYANDYTEINKYCDRVELMTYDQGTADVLLNKARPAPYAPVADPKWVETVVKMAAQTISRNKIIVGIPTYGYEYKVTPIPGVGYNYKRLWAFNPKYAIDIAAKLGITPTRTSANEIGFVYYPSALENIAPTGSDFTTPQHITATDTIAEHSGIMTSLIPFNFMTWSDAEAIADKVQIAHDLGVRGVAIFSLGGAEDQGMWEVLR